MKRMQAWQVVASLLVLGAVGCGDEAIVGDWRGDTDGTEENKLDVGDDLSGDGRIYFVLDGQPYYADFDVEVTANDDTYEIDWQCQGDCAALDFTMDCDVRGDDDDQLRCDGDGGWRDYRFEWQKRN